MKKLFLAIPLIAMLTSSCIEVNSGYHATTFISNEGESTMNYSTRPTVELKPKPKKHNSNSDKKDASPKNEQ